MIINEEELRKLMQSGFDKLRPHIEGMTNAMMDCYQQVLLTAGVMSLSYGVNQGDTITTITGALCLGVYNGIYYHKVENK